MKRQVSNSEIVTYRCINKGHIIFCSHPNKHNDKRTSHNHTALSNAPAKLYRTFATLANLLSALSVIIFKLLVRLSLTCQNKILICPGQTLRLSLAVAFTFIPCLKIIRVTFKPTFDQRFSLTINQHPHFKIRFKYQLRNKY